MSNTETDDERVQRAINEVQKLRKDLRADSAARLAQMRQAGQADLEDTRKRVQRVKEEEEAGQRSLLGRMPAQATDYVLDVSFTPGGKINLSEAKRIEQWDDGEGNIIYTVEKKGGAGSTVNEIRALSFKIREQQGAFGQLDPKEQSRLLSSSSEGTESGVEPYRDYLHSEALRKRFYHLKQHPPRSS